MHLDLDFWSGKFTVALLNESLCTLLGRFLMFRSVNTALKQTNKQTKPTHPQNKYDFLIL